MSQVSKCTGGLSAVLFSLATQGPATSVLWSHGSIKAEYLPVAEPWQAVASAWNVWATWLSKRHVTGV